MSECIILRFPGPLTGEEVEHVYSLTPYVFFDLTPRDAAALAFLARRAFEAGGTPTPYTLVRDALVHHAKARGWTPRQEQGPA